jgi:hypothetical protein
MDFHQITIHCSCLQAGQFFFQNKCINELKFDNCSDEDERERKEQVAKHGNDVSFVGDKMVVKGVHKIG